MSDWHYLRKDVLEQVNPSQDDVAKLKVFVSKVLDDINSIIKESDIDAVAEVHGSVAHGTWVKGEQDLDIFIVLDKKLDRSMFKRVLDLVKGYLDEWVEAYAEHPYVQAWIDEYKIDFVPCFGIELNQQIISSTDRTPLHTKFLRNELDASLFDEVRLLKQFIKGIGVYGAEIKTGGFSGYLCELLILRYNGFTELLSEAESWGESTVIYFNGDHDVNYLVNRYDDPLIVIDPVDRSRNVASAVVPDSYWKFVSAARAFNNCPDMRFFYSNDVVQPESVLLSLKDRETDIVFLVIEESEAQVPDSLWGQINKTEEALSKLLIKNDFRVYRGFTWSNEKTRHIFVFELESATIAPTRKTYGPPVHMELDVEKYFEALRRRDNTVSGPGLEDGRWWVISRRKYTDAVGLLGDFLMDGGRDIGVSRNLSVKILQHHRVLLNEEIEGYLIDGFEVELYRFLRGTPVWFN